MTNREQARLSWLESKLKTFEPPILLAGDASFRHYYRLRSESKSYVLMDAPPQNENCDAFIAIDRTLRDIGLHAPEIFCSDCDQGFLLLTDFGDVQLLRVLNDEKVDSYYNRAFEILLSLHQCHKVDGYHLPKFNEALYQTELDLFRDWYLKRHLGMDLSKSDLQVLDRINKLLIESALSQPQIFVHRDFHSRNLMVLPDGDFGILDFQDAVEGPITYDLMSLLRDCYIAWPYERVKSWVYDFHQRLLVSGLLEMDDPQQFLFWCDWIAMQRHLKCIGIFSRLNYRDQKQQYMNDIPRVIEYARFICHRHKELAPLLGRFL